MSESMKVLGVIFTLAILASCSSGPDTVEELDETYKSGTGNKGDKVGLRDDKIVIQNQAYLEEQLWKYQSEIEDTQKTIYGRSKKDPGGMWLQLQTCRKRISDPRIGGTGTPEKMEKWEDVTKSDADFKVALDKQKRVKVVKEETLDDRVANLKRLKASLSTRFDTFKEKSELCESKYTKALVDHGFNPEDTKSKGEWVMGPSGYRVWKMTRPSSYDPEELMKRKQKRESQKK